MSYGGSLRKRYLAAESSLMHDGPISSGDYVLRAFLKSEKVQFSKFAKPRMIFPRSPRYNLALASYLKPFEHWLWGNLKSVAQRGVLPSRVVAKGLNPHQRANLIRRKMRGIRDCVVFEVDGKAFEAHVDVRQLLQEDGVYLAAFGDTRNCAFYSTSSCVTSASPPAVCDFLVRVDGQVGTLTLVWVTPLSCVLSLTV